MMEEIKKLLIMVRKCPIYIRKSLNYIKKVMMHKPMNLQKNLQGKSVDMEHISHGVIFM